MLTVAFQERKKVRKMIDLTGKVAVVFGLANKRSIAYAIAHKLAEAGATLAICYQSERLQREAEALVTDLGLEGKAKIFQCDVSKDEEIQAVFTQVKEHFGTIYTVVHAVAFAPPDAIHNDFLLTTREAFRIAHDVSVYSLIAISRAAAPLMTEGGSILTLTYLGADKVIPNYNVMGVAKAALQATVRYLAASLGPKGIRVNAISAGPIKTLAARGIGDLQKMLDAVSERAPLKRGVDQTEVGGTALFLASPLASAITGEVLFVDCGFNIIGL
jgi:enoyl-[acyl-carrier protein] reductase I